MTTGSARSFGAFVSRARRAGRLVVQPRMGMSDPGAMRAGLLATRAAAATTVGTITLDSYTRVGDHAGALAALAEGMELNGYPIVAYDTPTTTRMVEDIDGRDFPVQVRHGSACPERIVAALLDAGLHATEGGPVSYCLPYSRVPLRASLRSWAHGCEMLAQARRPGVEPHLESFGGCMLGQLCPPGLLVALSVLECLFFRAHGLRSVSLSYAQQTNAEQDREAVSALRRLAAERLPDIDTHVVVYAYMGVYPVTPAGAVALLAEAARLAVDTGAARLIVKTAMEAHRIPSVQDNVLALEAAAAAATAHRPGAPAATPDTGIYAEARALVDAVVDLAPTLDAGLPEAFRRGVIDVPFCLHPDNAGRARSYLDGSGRLGWARVGGMPLDDVVRPATRSEMSADDLLASLSYVRRTFDEAANHQRRGA